MKFLQSRSLNSNGAFIKLFLFTALIGLLSSCKDDTEPLPADSSENVQQKCFKVSTDVTMDGQDLGTTTYRYNAQDLIDTISSPLKSIIEKNMAHNVVSRMASISNLVSDSINRIGSERKTVQTLSHNGIYSDPQSFFDAIDNKQVAGEIFSDSKQSLY